MPPRNKQEKYDHACELATVLAALRYVQTDPSVIADMGHFNEEIGGRKLAVLNRGGIESLCQRINMGQWKP